MSPIASCAKNCLGLFEDLVELLQQPAHQDDYGISDTEITDAFGRFKIWAGNIGAFQQIDLKSSLDFRLRDTPKISTQILEILDDLAESLADACSIASESRENRKGASLAHVEETQDDTDGPQVQSEEEEELSEIREVFGSIQDAINNLFRYSIIIRKNTNRDRYAKAAAAAISSPFSNEFDIQHVRHKFPALQSKDHEWLIERLGKAITQRRQYLRYCRSHHDKTWQEPSPKVGPDIIRSNEQKPQASMRLIHSSRSDFSKPTSTLAPTQASTLFLKAGQVIEEEGIEESQSQTSYATSTDEESNNHALRVIQLEDVSKGLSHFECPYCWQIQTCRNQKAWKKHVLSDLKPYVCTFEDCELKLFSDRQTWFSHELKDHRKEWSCHFCAHFPFDKAAAYHAHLTSHHPHAFTEDQLPALFEMSQKPLLKIPPTDCPFCDDWEDRLRAINSHIPAEESLVVTPSQFQHHVGAHMVQLALFAVPRGYTEEGEADSANAIPQIESDDSSLGDDPPDLVTAEQFRKCEDILDELIELGGDWYHYEDMREFQFPAFSASIPYFGRTVRVSPVDFPQISQKLQTGFYSDINAFCLDLVLFFALIRFRSLEIRKDYYVVMAFHRSWGSLEGNICPSEFLVLENLIYKIERQIQWSFWRANEFPPELGADTREACRIRLLLKSGGTVERRFSKSAALEDVYAFVECYELIKDGSPLPQSGKPIGYIPEYNFKLGSIIAPKYHLDLQMCTVGDLLGNFADLMVVGLQKGEEPQTLSRTKRRSLSPISDQTPRIDSTTSMPRDEQVSTSGNDELAMPQSPGAFSTRNSGSYPHQGASTLPCIEITNDELASIGSLKGESIGPKIGTLTVLVNFARNLQPGYRDSYCRVFLGAACRVTKKDPLAGTPFWDEAFHFSRSTGSWNLMGQNLEVHVLNGDGTLIGSTRTIDLRNIGENIQERWHKLYRVNQIAGEIRLGLMFSKDEQPTSDSPTGHIDADAGLSKSADSVTSSPMVGSTGSGEWGKQAGTPKEGRKSMNWGWFGMKKKGRESLEVDRSEAETTGTEDET